MANTTSDDSESAIERTNRLLKRCKPCCVVITRLRNIEQIVMEGMPTPKIFHQSLSQPEISSVKPKIVFVDISEPDFIEQSISQSPTSSNDAISEVESNIVEEEISEPEILIERTTETPIYQQEKYVESILEPPSCDQIILDDPMKETSIHDQEKPILFDEIFDESTSETIISDQGNSTESILEIPSCDQEILDESTSDTIICSQEDFERPILETPSCDQEPLDAPICDPDNIEEPILETPNRDQEILEEPICDPDNFEEPILTTPNCDQEILEEPICGQDNFEESILETSNLNDQKNLNGTTETSICDQKIPEEPIQESPNPEQQISQQLISEKSISQPLISMHKMIPEVGSIKNPYAISKKPTVCRKSVLDQPFSICKFVKNQEVGSVKNPFASYRHPTVSIDELTLLYFQAISGVLFNNTEKEEDDVDNFINGLIEKATFSENEFLSLLDSLELPNA